MANIAETTLLWIYIYITILCYACNYPQGANMVSHLVRAIRYILQNLNVAMTQLVNHAYEASEAAMENPSPLEIPCASPSEAIVCGLSLYPSNITLCANHPEESKPSVIDVSKPSSDNINNNETHDPTKLSNSDIVFITSIKDVHNVYVRKVKDKNDDFMNFIKDVNSYCFAGRPIGKFPRVNDIIGAPSIRDGLYYRAKILHKYSDVKYYVQFIDFGHKEYVHLSVIVTLPAQFTQIPTTVSLVKLKDFPFCTLNDDAREYVNSIIEHETVTIDNIEEDTNDVILKTSNNQNINNHLSFLIFGCNEIQAPQM